MIQAAIVSGASILIALLNGTVRTSDVTERERLAKEAIKEFYTCVLGDQPVSSCPDILDDPRATLDELSPEVKASLDLAEPTAAVWTYYRRYGSALGPRNLEQPPYIGRHVRFVSSTLSAPTDLDHLSVEVIAGAAEPAQATGVIKVVGIGLKWSESKGRYLVSPVLVNGIHIVPPHGVELPPRDLLRLLGFDSASQPR